MLILLFAFGLIIISGELSHAADATTTTTTTSSTVNPKIQVIQAAAHLGNSALAFGQIAIYSTPSRKITREPLLFYRDAGLCHFSYT